MLGNRVATKGSRLVSQLTPTSFAGTRALPLRSLFSSSSSSRSTLSSRISSNYHSHNNSQWGFAAAGSAALLCGLVGSSIVLSEEAAAPAVAEGEATGDAGDDASADPAPPATGGESAAPTKIIKKRRRVKKKKAYVDAVVLPNPGTFAEIGRSASDVLQYDLIQGLRLEYNMAPVAPTAQKQFVITHTVAMGLNKNENPDGASYDFNTHLANDKMFLMARVFTDGRLLARYHQEWSDEFSSRVIGDLSTTPGYSQCVVECNYKGSDYSAQVNLGSLFGLSYLQSITPTIALGTESMFSPQQGRTATKLAVVYKDGDDMFTTSWTTVGILQSAYSHKVDSVLTLAAALDVQLSNLDSIAMVGYQYKLKNMSVVKGGIDSTGKCSLTFDQILLGVLKFSMTGEVDHLNKEYTFGLGFAMG